jgi:hypothetical protein
MRGNEKIRIKPVLVPSFKIKTYLISRRQHLKRLRNFINNEEKETTVLIKLSIITC